MRQLLTRLSQGVVLKRRLPREFGTNTVYVSPESGGLKYWKMRLSDADPNLLRSVKELVRPGNKVWDVGANVGLVAYAAAHLAGPSGLVLAVEPDIDNLMLLRRSGRNLDLRKNARVELLQLAISRPGVRFLDFAIAKGARATNCVVGLRQNNGADSQEIRRVPAATLDDLLEYFTAPDFVKIDVEGAELDVLRGATKLLSTARPKLLIEVWSETTEEVTRILKEHGYGVFDASLPMDERKELKTAPWDTLAIPAPLARCP